MKLRIAYVLLLAFALILPCASSLEIESESYDFYIVGSSVYVEEDIVFEGSVTGAFRLSIPEDAEGVSLYIDDEPAEYAGIQRLSSAKEIRINYITKSLLDKGNFLANIKAGHNISKLSVKLVLEEGESIRKEKSNGLTTPSVFPKPTEITSDGRSIILLWEKPDFQKDEEFSMYVRIKRKTSYMPAVIVLVILAIAILIAYKKGILKFPAKEKKHEKKEKPEEKEVKKEAKIEKLPEPEKELEFFKNLKEDEQQVIRVLKAREGSCEQGTLRIVTGFSKARLSRLLMELEARKVIYKEKRGKKNLIFLKD